HRTVTGVQTCALPIYKAVAREDDHKQAAKPTDVPPPLPPIPDGKPAMDVPPMPIVPTSATEEVKSESKPLPSATEPKPIPPAPKIGRASCRERAKRQR